MPTELRDLTVSEISLVDVPANKSARVVLFKRDSMDEKEKVSLLKRLSQALGLSEDDPSIIGKKEGDRPMDEKLTKMVEELTAKVAKLEAEKTVAKLGMAIASAKTEDELKKLEAEVIAAKDEDLTKALEARKAELAKGGKYDAFKAKLSPAMQKAFDDMSDEDKEEFMSRSNKSADGDPLAKALDALTKDKDELAKKLAKLEDESAIAKIKADLGDIAKVDELALAVHKLGDTDAAKTLVDTIKAQAVQLKTAGLFRVLGKDGDGPDADTRLEKAAADRAKKDGISVEKAMDLVMQEQPDLYTATLKTEA